jgi:peroxiredoxin
MFASRFLVRSLLLLAVVSVASGAQSVGGPMVGDHFPHALQAPDQSGKAQSLTSVMGKKGLAVFFVRSADWCPFCKGQLVNANRHLAAFRALGIDIVSVSVDEVAPIAEFAKKQNIGYTMLSDPHGAINESLGIRDKRYPVGSAAFGVPRPTLYILDRQGVVRLRYQEPTFLTRPNLDTVLRDAAALQLTGAEP